MNMNFLFSLFLLGVVTWYDPQSGVGSLNSENDSAYIIYYYNLYSENEPFIPFPGQKVDFIPENGIALQVKQLSIE